MEEAELVEGLRAGNEQVFETVVRTYGGRLLAVARRMLHDEEDARDAVQEAFINAYRSRASFKGDAKISTWLHSIVVNTALMKLRARRRRPEDSIDELLPSFASDGHQAVESREWSDALLERKETAGLVRDAIARLPEPYRLVLVLRDLEERDTAETARILGTTTTVVKVRLHRARQALRTLLDREFRS